MRGRAGLVAVAAVASFGGAACSVLLDWNYAGVTGGMDGSLVDTGAVDTGTEGGNPKDGGATDVGPDLGSGADAGTDAGEDTGTDAAQEAAVDAGNPSLCADAGFVFCDGFENGQGAWMPTVQNGSAAIDPTMAYRGTHSLHVHVDAVADAGLNDRVVWTNQSVSWPSSLYIRVYARFVSAATWNDEGFLVIGGNNGGAQLELLQGSSDLAATVYGNANATYKSTQQPSIGNWVCFELFADGQSVDAYVGDTPVPGLSQSFSGSLLPWAYLTVGVGLFQAAPQPAIDVWIDEVAVDASYIQCDR